MADEKKAEKGAVAPKKQAAQDLASVIREVTMNKRGRVALKDGTRVFKTRKGLRIDRAHLVS